MALKETKPEIILKTDQLLSKVKDSIYLTTTKLNEQNIFLKLVMATLQLNPTNTTLIRCLREKSGINFTSRSHKITSFSTLYYFIVQNCFVL